MWQALLVRWARMDSHINVHELMELRCRHGGTDNRHIGTHSVCEVCNVKCYKGKQRQRLMRKSVTNTVQGNARPSVGSESLTPVTGRQDALKCATHNRENRREVVPGNLEDNV